MFLVYSPNCTFAAFQTWSYTIYSCEFQITAMIERTTETEINHDKFYEHKWQNCTTQWPHCYWMSSLRFKLKLQKKKIQQHLTEETKKSHSGLIILEIIYVARLDFSRNMSMKYLPKLINFYCYKNSNSKGSFFFYISETSSVGCPNSNGSCDINFLWNSNFKGRTKHEPYGEMH